jgi:hypothetical protein
MENLKYELDMQKSIVVDGHTLYRIRALRSFGKVQEGDYGGYVESLRNLSHDGLCWINRDARVYEQGHLHGDAQMNHYASMFGTAEAYDDARLEDECIVCGDAEIREAARVKSSAYVSDSALLGGTVRAAGACRIVGDASLGGKVQVNGRVEITGSARLTGKVSVAGSSFVGGDARLSGNEVIRVDAFIMDRNSCMTFSNVGSEFGTLTAYRNIKGGITVTRGCFDGDDTAFLAEVRAVHRDSPITREYELMIEIARSRLSRKTETSEDFDI